VARNVRVIWYRLDEAEDPRAAFIRLNVGRIPLTSAELIRALFLRGGDRGDDELKRDQALIAQDWDMMERRLQDSAFWWFLQRAPEAPASRIEYLFDMFVELKGVEVEANPADPLGTFFKFESWLGNKQEKDEVTWSAWRNVHRCAQILEEWFDDPVLYHLVGYLVATEGMDERGADAIRAASARMLVDLLRQRADLAGADFERRLRAMIWQRFRARQLKDAEREQGRHSAEELQERIEDRVGKLRYGGGRTDHLRSILLLFNIAEVVNSGERGMRFPFDRYHGDAGGKRLAWDIEHVRSVTEKYPALPAERRQWLEDAGRLVASAAARARDRKKANKLAKDIKSLRQETSPDKEAFEDVFNGVRDLSGEADARQEDNALSNLALLDARTNRSYKNAVFPMKRERIIGLDRESRFVPPSTRRVFLKYYTEQPEHLIWWDDNDQQGYHEAMVRTFATFFEPMNTGGAS